MTTQPDTDAPPTHTPGCSLSTAEASGHNRCGCWCHAGPPFRYTPDEVAAVLRPDLGRCHRETCEHGHVDHRPRNACRWCDCKAFVPSDAPQEGRGFVKAAPGVWVNAPQEGRPTTDLPEDHPLGWQEDVRKPRPTTPQTEAGEDFRWLLMALDWDVFRQVPGLYSSGEMRDIRRRLDLAIEREAAAGALPSVERLADALPQVLNFEFFGHPVGHPKWQEIAQLIVAELEGSGPASFHESNRLHAAARLVAAPPEASER
jgi:hypothetical protein